MKAGFVVVMMVVALATAVDSCNTCEERLLSFEKKCLVPNPPVICITILGGLYTDRCVADGKLETDVKDLKAQLTALRAKVDTIYQPVAFTAYLSNDDQNGMGLGEDKVIYYDAVDYNVGGAYNSTTGKFTAPRAGTYVFMATVMGKDTVRFEILKNGKFLHFVYAHGNQYTGSKAVTTHLAAGDKVWVELNSGYYAKHKYRGGAYTGLSGFLLIPDQA